MTFSVSLSLSHEKYKVIFLYYLSKAKRKNPGVFMMRMSYQGTCSHSLSRLSPSLLTPSSPTREFLGLHGALFLLPSTSSFSSYSPCPQQLPCAQPSPGGQGICLCHYTLPGLYTSSKVPSDVLLAHNFFLISLASRLQGKDLEAGPEAWPLGELCQRLWPCAAAMPPAGGPAPLGGSLHHSSAGRGPSGKCIFWDAYAVGP